MSVQPIDPPTLQPRAPDLTDGWTRALRSADGLVVEIGHDGQWSVDSNAAGLLDSLGIVNGEAQTTRGLLGEAAAALVDEAVAGVIAHRGVQVIEVPLDHQRAVEFALVPSGEARVSAWIRDASGRRQGQQRIVWLVRAQEVAHQLSSALLDLKSHEMNAAINKALSDLGDMASADRAYVFLIDDDAVSNTHEWCAAGIQPQRANLQDIPRSAYAFFLEPLLKNRPLFIPSVADLPETARAERALLAAQGIERLLAVPIAVDRQLLGFLGVDNPRIEALKPSEFSSLMRLLGDTMGAGLHRARAMSEQKALMLRLADRTTWQRQAGVLSIQLARCSSLDAIAEAVAAEAPHLLGVQRVELAVSVSGSSSLRRWTLAGGTASPEVSAELSDCKICAQVLRDATPVATTGTFGDSSRDWTRWASPDRPSQIVCLPLDGPEGPSGVFTLIDEREVAWSDEEVSRAAHVASLLGAHVAAARARESLAALNAALEDRVAARTHALVESNQRFKTVFEQAPYAVLRVDAAGQILDVNDRAKHLFDRGADALRDSGIADLFTAAHAAWVLDAIRELASQDVSMQVKARQVEALREQGLPFEAEVLLSQLPEQGQSNVLVAVQDVSYRRRLDEVVVRANAQRDAAHRDGRHQVQHSLDTARSLLALLADQLPGQRSRNLVEETMLRLDTMAMVHEFLASSAIEGLVDLGDISRKVVDAMRQSAPADTIIEVRSEPAPMILEGATGMALILRELVHNALKYGLRRPSPLNADLPERQERDWDVLIEVGTADGDTWLSVTDRGPGLPPSFVLDAQNAIGLQFVRTIARKHGMTIHHQSVPGARFRVHWRPPEGEAVAEKPDEVEVQLIEDGLLVESVPLGADPVIIGRNATSTLISVEPTVSGRHAAVWVEGHHIWIEDLGSRNGTFVNGTSVTSARRLNPEDRIGLGHRAGLRLFSPTAPPGPPLGFVIEDLGSGARHLATSDRVRLGGSPQDDVLVPGAPSEAAVLLLDPCGLIGVGRPPTSEQPLRFGQPFTVADRRFRVYGVAPTATTTASAEPVTYPYAIRLGPGPDNTVKAVLVHLEAGSMQPIHGRANATTLAVLARKWSQDRAARVPFRQRGWVATDELTAALAEMGCSKDTRDVSEIVTDLRAIARRGGFEPWFIDTRKGAARLRVRHVTETPS